MNFQKALAFVLKEEGGYVDDPLDPGGRTNHGITQATFARWLKANNLPVANVEAIHPEEVWAIYREDYWKPGRCEKLPGLLQLYHFDACVHHGILSAGRLLQRALNHLNPEVWGGPLAVDGLVGPKTIGRAVVLGEHGETDHYLWERLAYFRKIVANRPSSLKFLPQWTCRLEHLFYYKETT